MKSQIQRVAILGGGPSGAALGAWLAREGVSVVIFDRGKRPPIVVGESLVPAIVPYLQDLGVEDEVAAFSIWKGGATFIYDTDYRLSLRFDEVRHARTTYSYNTPRDLFDRALLGAAKKAGVHVVEDSASLERDAADGVRLVGESAETARDLLGGEPDLVVDAGGRTRTIARLLDLPTVTGDRKDAALHAHLEGVEVEVEGNVHTD
ncbi:MAG: tryptophan 7-halogenase, partial [Myxococcota bacterium]|nr:tryptophan 7-halogenase [Myxococcota bacterium]